MAKKPNILVIYSDQFRADCMASSGNPDVKTPFLSRLAQEGVMFENAFVSYPLCTPFRASFLTGKYAHAAGVYSNHFPMDPEQPSIAPILREQGYRNGYIGKWHLFGGPKPGFVPPGKARLGFDDFVGYNRGHQYMDSIYFRDSEQPYHSKRYEPDYQTDHTIEFMERALSAKDGNPFFAYVCFGPPHFPMVMPEYWRTAYDPAKITLPHGTPDPEHQRRKIAETVERDFGGDASLPERSKTDKYDGYDRDIETEAQLRKFVAEYYGMISNVDHNVGILLNWLDAKGIAEDTIVIFMSDHGDMLGQHGGYCGNKRQGYRSAANVPFLVRWPGHFSAGKRVQSMVDIAVDTMPTLLQACGVPLPDGVQGVSYLPLLTGDGDVPTRDHVQYELMRQSRGGHGEQHGKAERGIRTREWLFVRKQDRALYLFDQINDPQEMNNLVGDPAYAEIQAELDARVAQNMADTGDAWELEMHFPPPDYISHKAAAEYLLNTLKPSAIEVP